MKLQIIKTSLGTYHIQKFILFGTIRLFMSRALNWYTKKDLKDSEDTRDFCTYKDYETAEKKIEALSRYLEEKKRLKNFLDEYEVIGEFDV